MSSADTFTSKEIRQLLKAWDTTAMLGKHQLAQMTCVNQKMGDKGAEDTEIGRGMALKDILHEGIQSLRPSNGEADLKDKAWYSYIIIRERYCFGRLPEWIMVHLNISKRSFYRELRVGTDRIGAYLRHAESEARLARNQSQDAVRQEAEYRSFLPPSLPKHPLVARDQLAQSITNSLVSDPQLPLALIGLPGVGKTTFVSMLLEQTELVEHFPDGFVWISLGQDFDLTAAIGHLAAYVGVPETQIRSLGHDDLKQRVREQLTTEKRLFILDDVWSAEDVTSLQLGGRGCATIVTTRSPAVGFDVAGRNAFTLPELTADQSKTFLVKFAPDLFSIHSAALETVVEVASGLPLALTIFGRYLLS
ncbi:MAG: NB-ARC domain-containing protein, partial [Chloroflexota bacterium]